MAQGAPPPRFGKAARIARRFAEAIMPPIRWRRKIIFRDGLFFVDESIVYLKLLKILGF
jgi:hypothetical protein